MTAHHVDHRLRPTSGAEADHAAAIADRLGVICVIHRVEVGDGPNLEARAREARQQVLPAEHLTGHTADDQAETMIIRLLRGVGADGLRAMEPGGQHPILRLRRADTLAVCDLLDVTPVRDPSNDDPRMWRNRVRNELIPLMADIAERDVVPLLTRTADLLRRDADYISSVSEQIDPTDAKQLATADAVLARRAIRRWLTIEGYPPDQAAVERVLDVARGAATACEIDGGRRVTRSHQRLRVIDPGQIGE